MKSVLEKLINTFFKYFHVIAKNKGCHDLNSFTIIIINMYFLKKFICRSSPRNILTIV